MSLTPEAKMAEMKRDDDSLMRALIEGVCEYALFLMNTDGIITLWGEGARRMKGFTREEAEGQHLRLLYPLPDRRSEDGTAEEHLRYAAEHGEYVGRGHRQHSNGTTFWALVTLTALRSTDGELMGFAKVTRNIEKQRARELEEERLQAELALERERLRAVLTHIPAGVLLAEAPGAAIVLASPQVRAILGIDPATAHDLEHSAATSWLDRHGEPVPADARPLTRALRGERVDAEEFQFNRPDGRRVWIRVSALPTGVTNGQVRGALAVVHDIDAEKRAEQALLHTQKLESLGVLAGGVAHDFNNLLTGILGNASLAVRHVSPAGAELLQDIVRASERAADLTRQLLAYAGKGRFYLEPVDLRTFLPELATLVRTAVPRTVEIKFDLAPDTPLVEVDRGQLQQLVMNLVINGAEAIGDRPGTVTVRTSMEELTAADLARGYHAFDLPPGRYVCLAVEDMGSGMTPATMERIFDPFFTTKFLGRGLGLAAALGIVRGHRGGLRVQSEVDRGTTFSVLLPPAAGDSATGPATEPAAGGAASEGRGLVLVVDDEESVRSVARHALEEQGFRVLVADNGREGVELFTPVASEVRLVFLDLTMPLMNGVETLRHLRRVRTDVPVVVMSGYGDVEVLRQFPENEIRGFLAKPFTAPQLVDAVNRHIDQVPESPPR